METKTKKWVVAVLFAVLFACVALLSLGVTAFTSTRARAADASPEHDYTSIRVVYSLIYASDTNSDLIKDHLTVYGTAEDLEEEVQLKNSEYTVYLGNAEGGTTDNWSLSTSVSNTFTVVAGSAQTSFSAVAETVRVSSVVVTPSFTVSGGANYKGGSVLYLYTFDNVKANITVVGYNNDGRPYNGSVENSTLSADTYSVIGSSDPGTQSLSVQWVHEGSTITSSNFTAVLTQDEVEELIVDEETLPESVESSSTVSYALFTGTEITARYLSGREEVIQQLSRVTFTGTLHEASAAEGETFRETITASYEGVRTTFQISVTQVTPVSITLMNASGITNIEGQAYERLDTTGIIVMVMYAGGTQKILQNLSSEEFDIEYSGGDESHSNDYFRVGDTQATVTFIDAGISPAFPLVYTLDINKTPVEAPTFDTQDLTFNGNEQSKTLGAAYNADIMKITDENGNSSSELMTFDQASGSVTVTNAGTYTFRVYLTDKNYTFSSTPSGAASRGEDENGEYIVYTFTVIKQSLENWSFTVNISDWVYQQYSAATNGPSVIGLPEEVDWDWNDYITYYFYGLSADGSFDHASGDAQVLDEENLIALGVGEYYVYAVIAETANYQGYRIPGTRSFSVKKQTVEVPAGLDQVYNGGSQQANTSGLAGFGDIFTMSCDEQTNVPESGSYTATFTLTHPENYRWASTESASVTVNWTITQGQNEVQNLSVADANAWYYGDEAHEVTYNLLYTDGAVVSVIYWKGDEELGTTPPTDAGTYKVVVTVGETRNYKGDSAELSFTIKPKELDLPTVVYAGGEDGYVYSGSAINVVVRAGYLEDDIAVTGANSLSPYFTAGGDFAATDAKNGYSLQLTPTANYAWAGGSQAAQSILWNILPKELKAPAADGGTFTYDGTNKVYTFGNYQTGMTFTVTPDADEDKDGLSPDTAEGTVTAIHAGTYTIEVGLVSGNYAWAGEYDLTFEFVIGRATTANPVITGYDGDGGYIYNYGETITVQVTPDDRGAGHYTFGGDVSATDAGGYELVVKLDSDYQWQTASTENGNNVLGDLTLAWNIVAREIEEPALDTLGNTTYTDESLNATLTYDDRAVNISFTADDPSDEDGKSISGNTLTVFHAGGYTVRATLENTSNFVWQEGGTAEKTLTWQVAKAQNAVTRLSIGDWVYGEEAKQPSYSVNFGTATIVYDYRASADGGWEGKSAPDDAGYYRVTVSVDEGDDWEAAAAVSEEFFIERATVAKPVLGEFDNRYTGSTIEVVLSGEGLGEKYEIVSGGSGTNAQGYEALIQLHQNYKWSDDESAYDENVRDFTVGWQIVPRTLSRLTLGNTQTSVIDNKQPGTSEKQENELVGYNAEYASAYEFTEQSEGLSRENNMLSAVNAGAYSVTVSLANGNFAWATEGEVSYTLEWTIDKKVVRVETTGGVDGRYIVYGEGNYPEDIYNSAESSAYYRLSDQIFWSYSGGSVIEFEGMPSDYGIYYISFTLKDSANFAFETNGEDGTSEGQNDRLNIEDPGEIKIWYSIAKAGYTLTAKFDSDVSAFEYGSGLGEIDYDISGENGEVIAAIKAGQASVSYIYFTAEDERLEAAPTDAGSYYVVVHISEPEGGNYREMDSNEVAFTITPKKLTVTFTGEAFNDGYSFEYGKAAKAGVSVDGYEYSDSEETSPVTLAYFNGEDSLGSSFPTNVGNYTVVASVADANYYIEDGSAGEKLQSTSAGYNVTPAELTVMVEGQNITYGDSRGEWVLSATGWVTVYSNEQALYQADFLEAVEDAISCDYEQGSYVGNYPITLNEPANIGDWAKNYNITYESGKQVSVSPCKLTVVITGGEESYTYGDVIEHGYEFVNLYNGDKVTVTLTYTGTGNYNNTTAPKNVGTYSVTASISDNDNYVLDEEKTESVQFTIGQRELTIVIADKTTDYGEAAPDWTIAEYTNIVTGDEALLKDLVEKQGNFSCAYVAGESDVNTYTVTLTEKALEAIRARAGNYNIIVDEGSLTVSRRQITVEIADKTSIYGEKIVELTASVDTSDGKYGLVPGDADPWTLSAENISETSDAGTYTISGTATDGNYSVQFNTGTYTITPRQVEIDFTLSGDEGGFTVTYSGKPQKMTAEVSGTVNEDVITAEVTYNTESAPVNVNADGYTAKATLSGKKANNYYVSGSAGAYVRYAEQDFTIAKAKLTVKTYETDGTVVYGDEAAFGYEITGFVKGETESVLEGKIGYTTNYEPGEESGAVGGAYTVSYTEGSFTSGNYEISAAAENSFQVTAREVTLDLGSLIAESFVYGKAVGASAGINETLPDSIKGDDLRFSYTYAGRDDTERDEADAGEDFPTFAGKYTVTVTIGNRNYELTGANSKDYEITQKTMHVKADDKEITYGDSSPEYTISYNRADFAYEETAENARIDESGLAFNCFYRQGDNATAYSITASGLTSRNYKFEYEDGTLSVGKRTITVILSDAESTYGDARELYEQARVTAGSLYTGGTGGTNTEDTAREVYGFTVYRYNAETKEYLPFDGDFGSAETGAGTYYFVLVNNMPNNYVITVEGGYTVKDEEAGRHVIDPKSLQVDIIGNNSVTYDGNSHAITAEIRSGQDVAGVSMLSYYTGKDGTDYDSDTAPTNAGVYTVTFKSNNENYTSAEISATLTISSRPIDIVWNGGETETYTYDNKPKTVTAAYHPYKAGAVDESQSIALTAEVTSYEAYTLQGGFAAASGAREFRDAGKYTFTVSFAETDPNYVLPEVKTDTFTIERAAITVRIDDKTSEYGDDLAALTYRIEGDIYDAAETVFTLSTTATRLSNVGSDYEISGTVNEARGLNYIVAFYRNDETSSSNTAVYTIAPRALVVSATYNGDNTIVYGDAVNEDLFELSYVRANDKSGDPFVNEGDEEKIGFSSGLYDYSGYAGGLNGTKAGTQINVKIDTRLMSLDNYSFTFEGEASFTVIKRDIWVNGSFKANLPGVYTSYAQKAVMSADYIDGKIGGEVLGEHFDFTLEYFIQEEGEYKPVSGIINAGTYYITVALNNADTSSYELADAGYIEWKIEKAELNISLDGDLSADGVQNVVVRYGNALPDSELFEYLVIEGLLGDDAQNYREEVVGNLKATHDYSVADKNNPTAAGTRLPVTLAFEKELPNYVFANVGDDSHGTIEVAKRRINLSMNTYDDDGEVYGMYNGGQFEKPEGFWDIRVAEADVVGVSEYKGLVGDDKVGTDVTFTYIYYGTSYDRAWSYTLEEGKTENPTLAGIYTVRVTIESDNYIIYGGSAEHGGVEYVDLTYRILKQRVEAPAFVGEGIDNGNAQATGDAYMASVEFNSNVIGVVSDSWQAANGGQIISASMQGENMFIMTASAAGGYSVQLELKDPDNYVWEGDTGNDENTPYWTIEWRIVTYSDVSIEITGITVDEAEYGLKDGPFGSETVKWFAVEGWVYGVSFAAEDIGVQVTFEGGDGVYAGAIEYQFQRSVSGGWDSASSSFLGAGTYRVRAIVADPNYERKESAWVYYTIDKQTIEVPTVENGVYNHGAAVTSKLVGFDNALMSDTGLACEHVTLVYSGGAWYLQANVVRANHFIWIALTDPSNYCWLQDGETLSQTSVQVNWTIERYKVKAPEYSEDFSAEYNGSIITFAYTDSEDRAYYRVSGASGTNAGDYTFTVSLVNTNNYEWEDKTTGSITVGWNIAKAANSWLDDEYSRAGWTYGGAPTAEKLPSAKFGNIAVAYYTDADCTIPIDFGAFTNGTPARTYYVVVTVADSTNYTSPEPIKGEFTVGKAPVTVIWDGAEGLVYNGQIQEAPTASYNALLGQGSVELIVTPSFEGEFKDAGSSYTFTAAFKESDEYAANYYIASGGSTVRAIAAAEVHVEVLPQSAVYTGGKPDVLQEENQAYRISSGDTYSDFNLTFSIPEDAVDAGTYVIDAECSSTNYAVTFTGSALFTITPKDISISITAGGGTYGSVTYATATASDENAQNSLSLTYAGTPNGGGFTEFGPGEKPAEAGSYIVTATVSDGNYNVTGTNTAAFIIAKARVTVQPISDKPYNGNLQKAEPVVSCSVEEDGIYTVTDEGGTDVGNYAVRFEFGENKENNFVWFYNGSEVNGATMTLNFAITIVKAENNPVTLEKPDGWTYGDEAETLEANAAFGTPVLYYATDENGAYGTNVPVHAGTYWVKAVVSATTNYEGSESAAYEFTISALELETPEFADAETVYNGGAQTNAFTGYDRSMMTISSNSGALVTTDGFALRAMNAGEYYITFALSYSGGGQEGDYVWKDASGSETVTITWTIRQAVNDWDGTYERDGWTYGQAASEEKIPGADFGTVVVEYFTDGALQNEYTGVFDGSTAAGTYYVRITVEGNTNYTGLSLGADGSLFFTVEVAQNGWKDGQNAYERDGWTYGDEATEETLPVPEFGSASVAYYTDSAHTKPYTGSFDSRTNAGIYYVVITVDGSENYSGITLNGQFEVEKRSLALPDLADTADTAVETGDTLHNEIVGFDSSTMNMSELGSGITTIDGKLYLAAKDAGVYQITISLADTSNYQWTDGKDGDVTLVWTLRRAELESWTEESESRYPDVIVSADGGIHPLYTLEISSILEESYGDYDLSAYENAEIALGYDIGFTSGGEAVQPESAVTVRLKVTDEIASALGEGYTLLHLHGGEWSEVSYTVEDGYAVFTVTEFSAFLFITETPATSLVWLIIVLAVLLTVEIVLLVVAIVKRRKGRN